MSSTTVVTTEEVEPGIVLVTLNRPERLDAPNRESTAALHATFERITASIKKSASLRAALDMENRTQVLRTATGDMKRATAFRDGS